MNLMTIRQRIASQLTSGRWLLTMCAAVCMVMITIADCWLAVHAKKLLVDPAALLAIVTMTFMSYFQRAPDAHGTQPTPDQPNGDQPTVDATK